MRLCTALNRANVLDDSHLYFLSACICHHEVLQSAWPLCISKNKIHFSTCTGYLKVFYFLSIKIHRGTQKYNVLSGVIWNCLRCIHGEITVITICQVIKGTPLGMLILQDTAYLYCNYINAYMIIITIINESWNYNISSIIYKYHSNSYTLPAWTFNFEIYITIVFNIHYK
jgi:hypothetical protein